MVKNTGKVREKSGNFVSPEKWEPCVILFTGEGVSVRDPPHPPPPPPPTPYGNEWAVRILLECILFLFTVATNTGVFRREATSVRTANSG